MTQTELILIRHGQANSKAKDEASYDQLSELGHQQAKWLGTYFSETKLPIDHVMCGTLRRHKETAAGLNLPHDVTYDARLNEMRYFDMATELNRQTGLPLPAGPHEFANHLPHVMQAWSEGQLDHVHIPYADFAQQFSDVMAETAKLGGRSVIVTSGGVIAMAMARHLNLGVAKFADLLLPIQNTSLHHYGVHGDKTYLSGFNALPHLAHPDRASARTSV